MNQRTCSEGCEQQETGGSSAQSVEWPCGAINKRTAGFDQKTGSVWDGKSEDGAGELGSSLYEK